MLVSIIIPSYNHEKYIRLAVESVLRQTHAELELIVVDDGSSDNSVAYLRSVPDNRLRLFTQTNQGAHAAINRGLSEARGDVLAILNSDDIFAPNRIERCVAELATSGTDLVASWIEVINSRGKVLGVKEAWSNMLPWELPTIDWPRRGVDPFVGNLLMSNFVATTSNTVFTRSLYERVGGMRNLRFAHDWDFLLRAARAGRCKLLPEPLLQYRIHDSNTISSNRAWMLFEICWIMATAWRSFEEELVYGGTTTEELQRDAAMTASIINLQGNDRVYWMIRQFLAVQQARGVQNPEEILLDDAALRSVFVEQVRV